MPARDITGIKGRFLQAVLSRRFEGRDGYLLAIVMVAAAVLIPLRLVVLAGQVFCLPGAVNCFSLSFCNKSSKDDFAMTRLNCDR